MVLTNSFLTIFQQRYITGTFILNPFQINISPLGCHNIQEHNAYCSILIWMISINHVNSAMKIIVIFLFAHSMCSNDCIQLTAGLKMLQGSERRRPKKRTVHCWNLVPYSLLNQSLVLFWNFFIEREKILPSFIPFNVR